jgi:hypothetical protein
MKNSPDKMLARKSLRRVVWLGLAMGIAVPLWADGKPLDQWGDLLRRYGSTAQVKPGAWAIYRIHTAETPETLSTLQMKMSCVGAEKVDNQEGLWLEMESTVVREDNDSMRMIAKMLVIQEPSQEPWIRKVILQFGDQPPVAINPPLDSLTEESKPPIAAVIGDETVTVPAGTFLCKHLRETTDQNDTLDIFVSQDVALFGIVKAQASDGEVELIGHGATGATSQIKGEPATEFDMQRMMQELMEEAPAESIPKAR